MAVKNVVFLGSKKIGLSCLEILQNRSSDLNIRIIGILTNKRGEAIKEFAANHGIPVIPDLEAYVNLKEEVHIAISVQYHLILKKEHIAKASELTVNLHMAPLPEYRGCNQFSFAIIDDKEIFGTTIHMLEEGIDSGDILFEKRFPIKEGIWVDELYEETFKASVELFDQSLPNLISGNFKAISQDSLIDERGHAIHYRKEIEDIKKINMDWPADKINRHIRATNFPGFEPPYFYIDQNKIYFKKDDD